MGNVYKKSVKNKYIRNRVKNMKKKYRKMITKKIKK